MNMRQGQQHRRGRGRGGHNGGHGNNHGQHSNNNNRKIQNPLSRTYHSNGPDGKVSGSPQSIADKYLSLARDSLSSGDPVLAENYLQHAEHYNRIILAYREQVAQAQDEANGGPRQRTEADYNADFPDEETDTLGRDLSPLPPEQPRPRPEMRPRDSDQPRFDPGAPREGPSRDGSPREGGQYQDRQQRQGRDRFGDRDRGDRGDRGPDRSQGNDRNSGDRFTPRPAYGPDGQLLQERPVRDDRPRDDRHRDDRNRDDRNRERHFRPQGPRSDGPRDGPRFDGPRYDPNRSDPNRSDPNRADPGRADPGRSDPNRSEAVPREAARETFREAAPIEPIVEVPRIEPVAAAVSDVPEVRAPRRRERAPPVLAEDAQPDFLRRPVRRPRREAVAEETAAPPPAVPDRDPDTGG